MECVYNYHYPQTPSSVSLKNDQVLVEIFINPKYHSLDIKLVNKKKCKRKKIDTSFYLNEIITFLQGHTYIVHHNNEYRDMFNKDNVKRIRLEGLKIEDKDVKVLSRFQNAFSLETKKCTFYKDCNLGILKCDFTDINSDLYSLDSLNGFSGNCIKFRKTHIVRMNKNLLHLNNQVLELFGINMDYELFLLTTDAPNLRRLNIHHNPQLNNSELLFISGFYNLEGIDIDGVVDNYDQFDKLEKLRELRYVLLSCIDKKYENDQHYLQALKKGLSDGKLANILYNLRLRSQNNNYQLRHELYIPRLERIRFAGSIENKSIPEIQQELIRFYQLDYQTRKNYLREPKKELNLFDDVHNLFFDERTSLEEDEPYQIVNSRPFDESNGINYYVKRKKIILNK